MKKLVAILALALMLTLVGCGGKKAVEPKTEPTVTVEPAEMEVQGMDDIEDLSEEFDSAEFDELDSALADLEDFDI